MINPFALKKYGVLGVNGRNLDYLFPSNPRRLYQLTDNKLETKKIAEDVGVRVPETYGVIRFQNEVKQLPNMLGNVTGFVVKPASGSGGDGILVIQDISDEAYQKASGKLIAQNDLEYHIHNILSGMFSLSGNRDQVILEYAVQFDPVFSHITHQGVPDIRMIAYHGVPVMAMLRLPTQASDGKANLHCGGVGVGINLAKGQTTLGIQYNRYLEKHPETQQSLREIAIPHWEEIVTMSAKLCEKTEFGYLGIDFVLDEHLGPLLLEMNARPGLSIQICNQQGLIPRLEAVDVALKNLTSLEEKIAFSQQQFG